MPLNRRRPVSTKSPASVVRRLWSFTVAAILRNGFFSKVLETLEKAPEVYAAADRFVEAGDWLVWQLTGEETRSECAAGYKGMWIKGKGWPSPDFFKALHPGLENVVAEKAAGPLVPLGGRAGLLTAEMAEATGLAAGTPVAASIIDAHAAAPACSMAQSGRLAIIMGTSLCHMLLGDEKKIVEGCGGLVKDGIIPGFWGYEAGQAAVGDIYGWFFKTALTAETGRQAGERNMAPEDWLTEKAAALEAGESGLVALDWWNGSRSVLMDAELSGVIVGLTLTTRPEEIYRALIESTAFGTRVVIDAFEDQGVPIRDIVACGGLAEKSPLVMQIFADVTGRQILLPRSFQASGTRRGHPRSSRRRLLPGFRRRDPFDGRPAGKTVTVPTPARTPFTASSTPSI